MTAWIGPVEVTLYEPQLSETGSPTTLGLQPATITGMVEWIKAHQLRELVNNPQRHVTIGGQAGILEPLYFSDNLLGPWTGWALLQSFQHGPADQSHSLQGPGGLVPYTLSLQAIGDRQVVVVRSAREKAKSFSILSSALVANPFWDEDPAGSAFVTDPGGTRSTREYDASFPHSTPRLTPSADKARRMTVYTQEFLGADPFVRSVFLPRLALSASGPPAWVTDRGGDCRGYNRQEMRDVYGPSHHLATTTDLYITNGLVRYWLGNVGLPAFLSAQAFAGGAWHEVGTIPIDPSVLIGARLTSVSPDKVTAALVLSGKGDVFVTLKRGERMIRTSSAATTVRPGWRGTPPTSRLTRAGLAAGRFGLGLDGGGAGGTWAAPYNTWGGSTGYTWAGHRYNPDIVFLWPADVDKAAWSTSFWYRPDRAVGSLAGAGLLLIRDNLGTATVQVYVDEADHKIKAKIGSAVLASSVQTFTTGDDLLVGVGFSTTTGASLLIRRPNGTTEHVTDATITNPGTAGRYATLSYFGVQEAVDDVLQDTLYDLLGGSVTWGDGSLPGLPRFPNGVIDNHMIFEDRITNAEFDTLATAAHALDGLPQPERRLRWFAPFDAAPVVVLSAETAGQRVDPVVDGAGFQKAVARINLAKAESAVLLARTGTSVTDQQKQFAAESAQSVRVRVR